MRSPEKTGICPHCGTRQVLMLTSHPPKMRCCNELMWLGSLFRGTPSPLRFSVKGGTPRGNR